MKYTEERIIPDDGELNALFKRHLALYEFALQSVKDEVVLDAGCGEGYGADLLARRAQKIIAIDNSPIAIEHASKVYLKDNLEFRIMDATSLNFAEGNFGLIIAIEVIEHLKEYRKFLGEVCRTLKNSGTFILSTPYVRYSSSGHVPACPYHSREFSLEGFKNILREYFNTIEIFGIHAKGLELKDFLKTLDIFKLRRFLPAPARVNLMRKTEKNLRHEIDKKNINKSLNLIGICRNPKGLKTLGKR